MNIETQFFLIAIFLYAVMAFFPYLNCIRTFPINYQIAKFSLFYLNERHKPDYLVAIIVNLKNIPTVTSDYDLCNVGKKATNV